jgi:hypothetical protein
MRFPPVAAKWPWRATVCAVKCRREGRGCGGLERKQRWWVATRRRDPCSLAHRCHFAHVSFRGLKRRCIWYVGKEIGSQRLLGGALVWG